MLLDSLRVSPLETNCYIVACEDTREAIVIDPGDEAERIFRQVKKNRLRVHQIINTHGHIDHIAANGILKEKLSTEGEEPVICIHQKDAEMLTHPADMLLQEGDILEVGSLRLKVLHTPGHTPGGICLVCDKVLFSGDTLFAGSIGRCDLPGGMQEDILVKSIREKLLGLDETVVIYPGHGPSSTIGFEKANNPFLKP